MGNQKNKSIITSPTTHERDAGKGLMNQDNIKLAFLTDFSYIQGTVRHSKSFDEKGLNVNKWTT